MKLSLNNRPALVVVAGMAAFFTLVLAIGLAARVPGAPPALSATFRALIEAEALAWLVAIGLINGGLLWQSLRASDPLESPPPPAETQAPSPTPDQQAAAASLERHPQPM